MNKKTFGEMEHCVSWMVVSILLAYQCFRTYAFGFVFILIATSLVLLSVRQPFPERQHSAVAASARVAETEGSESTKEEKKAPEGTETIARVIAPTPSRRKGMIQTSEQRERLMRALFDEIEKK
jgi:hypothetical protein